MDPMLAIRNLGRPLHFTAGERIYSKGMPVVEAYIVVSGEIMATSTSADGQEIVFYRMGPDYGLAPITALCGGTYENDALAVTHCELLGIKATDLRAVLSKDPNLAVYFLDLALKRLRSRTQQWEDLSVLGAGARICKWLVKLASSQDALYNASTLDLPESERIIGQLLGGISRESVSRNLVALATAGVIARKGKSLRILNAPRLQLLANGSEPFPLSAAKRRKAGQLHGFAPARRFPDQRRSV
jgi:CRP/FNR family transcriptional regulator